MSKLTKAIITGVSYVLVAAMAIGGTVAYLTSEDSDVNVMTLGNVSIRQDEYQRVEENGVFTNKLEAFQQGKPMLPYVSRTSSPDVVTIGDFTATLNDYYYNYVDKIVAVTNTGKTDAYVRTLIALPTGGVEKEASPSDNWLHWNTWGKNPDTDKYDMDETWDSFYNNTDLAEGYAEIKINGMEYRVWEFVHTVPLAAGATACPTLVGVFMDCRVNNDDTGYYMDLNNNNKCDTDEKRINIPVGEPLSVYVLSQAVQTAGFDSAFTALDTAFGDVNATNAAKWFGDISNVKYVEAAEQKAQIEGNVKDLENGTDLIVDKKTDILIFDTNEVDAKGATVELNGTGSNAYGYLAFLPEAGGDVKVSNLNVTGSGFVEIGHYGVTNGAYTANNVKIENLKSTLANGDKGFVLGCAFMAFGDITLNDCVMTGATAKAGVIPVDLGCGQELKTNINNGKYGTVYCWSHSIVTVNGAEIDTLQVAPINGTVTIKAGSHVGTINVDYGSSATYATATNLAKIVIEDGATVDKIVFNGNTYTVAAWNAYVANLK